MSRDDRFYLFRITRYKVEQKLPLFLVCGIETYKDINTVLLIDIYKMPQKNVWWP